jgi:hypothetical protein
MVRYSEARPPGNGIIHLGIDRLIDVEYLSALLASKVIMIIVSGIEPAQITA